MEIIVSGKRKEVTNGMTVAELLNSEEAGRPRFASVVTRKEILIDGGFEDAVLQDGDIVEFIYTGDEKC